MNMADLTGQTNNDVIESVNAIITMIENSGPIKNADDLRKSELEIVAATDKIASALIETLLRKTISSEDIQTAAKTLVKSNPARMRNHGKRDVTIHPYRGPAFTVSVPYFCRAGLSEKKGKKKGLVFTRR